MTQDNTSTATTVRCDRCQAEIPLRTLPPTGEHYCPFCGAPQRLDAAKLAELRRYAQDVSALQAQVRASGERVEAWQRHLDRPASANVVGAMIVFGIFLLPALLATTRPTTEAWTQTALAIVGGVVCLGVALWWSRRNRRKRRGEGQGGDAVGSVGCPACGALNQIAVGEPVRQCTHCSAALLPSQTLVFKGVELAKQAARDAAFASYRTERQGLLRLHQSGVGNSMPLIIAGPWLVILAGTALMFTGTMITGTEPYNPLIFALWGLLFAGIAGLVFWLKHRRRRNRRWLAAAGALAMQFGGGRLREGVAGFYAWLDEHWAGAHLPSHLSCGPGLCAAELALAGHPALLLCDAIKAGEHHERKIHLLLAVPSSTSTNPELDPVAAALDGQGLGVERGQAGVVGILDERRVKQIARRPAQLGQLAATVAVVAGALASARA